MSDELTEALERFTSREPEIPFDLHDDLRTIIDAARAYAEGRQILWCKSHDEFRVGLHYGVPAHQCWRGYTQGNGPNCSIVPMRLCAERRQG